MPSVLQSGTVRPLGASLRQWAPVARFRRDTVQPALHNRRRPSALPPRPFGMPLPIRTRLRADFRRRAEVQHAIEH